MATLASPFTGTLPRIAAQSAADRPSPPSSDRAVKVDRRTVTSARASGSASELREDPATLLSPFEIVADDKGYYAGNTMSGTRLNSRIEDLGASITVVTKDQMTDFAMLDLNDIFNYEAGTEGTGNFTDFSFNRNGTVINNAQLNPAQANRLRGVGAANTTMGNFETSGRIPIDPLSLDSVEISRGPNAAIFGIGNGSGTVNAVPAAANLSRNKNQVTLRGDSSDGYRATLDLNRVLIPGVLAIRGSAVRQRDGYELKPSGTTTDRYNGMVRYRPFKSTMLTAYYTSYRLEGNRPNNTTPADMVNGWAQSGSPTYNASANTITVNGATRVASAADITAYFINPMANSSTIYMDQGGIGYWSTGSSTLSTTPATVSQNGRLYDTNADPTGSRSQQPLFQKFSAVSDKTLYDWSSVNLAAVNRITDKATFASALLDQVVVETPRHLLAFQLGWFHEDGKRTSRNLLGGDTRGGGVIGIGVDVNETRLDGTANPYFLRPFVSAVLPYDVKSSIERDTYRAQLAYKLDLAGEKSWLRWLGSHQVSAYDEYKHFITRINYRADTITDQHAWMPAGGVHTASPSINNGVYRYYLGDRNGRNVDYVPQSYNYGPYTMNYGNAVTGFVQEPVQLGSGVLNFSGGTGNELRIQKARGAIVQSHLLGDRLVTTLGLRHDELYTRTGAPVRYLADGLNYDEDSYRAWTTSDWFKGKGPTRTAGAVARPLSWLSLFVNKSDSFVPAAPAQDQYLQRLPDPYSKGQDAGFALNLFSGKLFIRVNQYTTRQLKARNGDAGAFASRLQRLEFNDATTRNGAPQDLFRLQTKAIEWANAAAAAQGVTLTPAQLETQVAGIMKLPLEYVRPFATNVSATNDIIAKGREVEINYNPSNYWTIKANVTEQKSVTANISPELNRYITERLPVWQSIVDPLIGRPWFTENYNGGGSAQSFLQGVVVAPLALAQAQEGKSRPQLRKYRFNLSTNFRLEALSDNPILKRFNIGGAVRWEDKGAIGYYGVQQLPAVVTTLDVNRPIYDKSHTYVDALIGYRAPFFSKKVMATWQLNVRNLTESGRLQPISANPDGLPSAYRIVDPRQFILSATFDL